MILSSVVVGVPILGLSLHRMGNAGRLFSQGLVSAPPRSAAARTAQTLCLRGCACLWPESGPALRPSSEQLPGEAGLPGLPGLDGGNRGQVLVRIGGRRRVQRRRRILPRNGAQCPPSPAQCRTPS